MDAVSRAIWEERMTNLNNRRAKEKILNSVPGVDNYCSHLQRIEVGHSLLDVGCGDMKLQTCLPEVVRYVGIDPYPEYSGGKAIKMEMEECTFKDNEFETVCMFMSLDSVYDFKKTIHHIKRVCSKNVLFLTGVNIEVNEFHTYNITEAALIQEMKPMKAGMMHYFHPKILLIEFKK